MFGKCLLTCHFFHGMQKKILAKIFFTLFRRRPAVYQILYDHVAVP